MGIFDLLSGTKVLEETTSKYNKKITVIRDFTWGTYIKVNGLTQSGGILSNIWKETIKKLINENNEFKSCLILGLGAGSVASIVYKNYPNIKITGVDIDRKIVQLGKKYLQLDEIKIQIKTADALAFVFKNKIKYDLILIDLYCGDEFPVKFEDEKFLIQVKKNLNKNGIAVFNRLKGNEKENKGLKMGRKLKKIFKKVEYFYPQANMELICYN